jgi:TonB family protein
VTVALVVGTDGRVEEAHVAKSNNPWFERPALDAVMKWKFSPGMKNGHAVKTRVQQEVRFNLSGVKANSLWNIEKGKNHTKLPPQLQWDTPPLPDATAMAVYPYEALVAGKKGKATIQFVVDDRGRIATARVIEATAPEFGAATLAMIDAWRFKPARKADGTPAGAMLGFQREFSLNSNDVPVTDGMRRVLRRLDDKNPAFASLADLDAPVKAISQRPPVYPSSLQEKGVEGSAEIEFFIDENGDAQLPRIAAASAPEFGFAAVQAVSTWRFTVPKVQGKPVIARVKQPVLFGVVEQKPRPPQPDPKVP